MPRAAGASNIMKRICVAGQKAMNARREARFDAGTSGKPSNKAGALFGRNPRGRRRTIRFMMLGALS